MNRSEAHTKLVGYLLCELSRRGFMVWKAHTGGLPIPGGFLRFGLPGQSDIIGIMPPNGRFLAVEAKTGTGRQSKQQRLFQEAVEKRGGLYIVARSVSDLDRIQP